MRPQRGWPAIYSVKVRSIEGEPLTYKVLTWLYAEKAIALAPGQSEFQLSYGLALEAAARRQDAVAAYRRYLELEPASPDAEKVKAHLAQLESPAAAPPAGAGS